MSQSPANHCLFINRPSLKLYVVFAATFLLLTSCLGQKIQTSFDPKTCLEIVPERVKGLQIIKGPRNEKSIIRDMVFPICNGHALFQRIQSEGGGINPGTVVFYVVVEYTGEVMSVSVKGNTIHSKYFTRRVSDFIMNTDFVLSSPNDVDSEFIYPVQFGG